jgi:hypothetical protein
VAPDPPQVGDGAKRTTPSRRRGRSGWRDTDTPLCSYQQVDEQALRRVVLEPTHRLEPRGEEETHNRTHNTPARDAERPRSVARRGTGS